VDDLRAVSFLGHISQPKITELGKEWTWVVADAP